MQSVLTERKTISRLARGYLICVIGTIWWSFAAIFIRYLTETFALPALVLAFWRDLTVAVTLALVFARFTPRYLRLERQHWRFILVYGLVLSLFNSLWTVSVALNGAAVSTVLAYCSAAFTAILGWKLFREKLGPVKMLAVTFSLLGCVFISGAYDPAAWRVNAMGIVTGLASGLGFAAYSLFGKAAARRSINPWTAVLYSFGLAALFLLGYNLIASLLPPGGASPNLLWLGGSALGWGALVLLALGPTIGGYGLYTVSLNYLPVSVGNIIATLEPVMTAALAFALLGERFSAAQWLGSILIIAGVIILRAGEQKTDLI